ncbi:MAG: reverse transcriptase domain-containing protein [Nanoarchaeota archaeon]|nr:reverse transcriptase domain-containing protein [Nanoarchaeota archaeon]
MNSLYEKLCSFENLVTAFKKAKIGKTKKRYVKRFKKDFRENILRLKEELINKTYKPHPLKTFILRDPKTRKINKSIFKDRVVHHALINVIRYLFESSFIYDSHANQIGKGNFKAIKRFDKFKRKVSRNNTRRCFVLKADIKHYFEEINHDILMNILKRKIEDKNILWLIKLIIHNNIMGGKKIKGMPLGNLTSQFFANVYLNELDQFVKHKLQAKYYIRYVDDFVILHNSKDQLKKWKKKIDIFLKEKLDLELHPNKSQILKLEKGIKFLGFRIFNHHKLLRKSNMKHFERKLNQMKIMLEENLLNREEIVEKLEGWLAYAVNGDTHKYRIYIVQNFNRLFPVDKTISIKNKKKYFNFLKKVDESELEFSVQKTLLMFCKGMRIKDLAEKREIKEGTVWKHLINLIEHKQISVSQVLPNKKIKLIANKIYNKKDGLKIIKGRLKKQNISYDEIACVLASIKSKNKKVS